MTLICKDTGEVFKVTRYARGFVEYVGPSGRGHCQTAHLHSLFEVK